MDGVFTDPTAQTSNPKTRYILTLLLRSVPRPSLDKIPQPFTPPELAPPPVPGDVFFAAGMYTELAELCQQYNLTIDIDAAISLDGKSIPEKLEWKLTDPSEGDMARELKKSKELREFEYRFNADVGIQRDTVWRKQKRLVVFDMDSTLIQQEVIDEIAAFIGVKEQVAEITERAMRGELDFSASLRSRCALLKGVPSTVFEDLKSNGTITFTPGADTLCLSLKRLGCKLAVLSGGFQPLAEWVKSTLNLDYAFANTLGVSEDGKTLNGEVIGEIVNAERKAKLLKEIAEKEGVDLRQVVAVGDGANDLVMMAEAGFGVAFNAKPKVQLEAPSHINTATLQDILYLFGYTAEEQDQLLNPDNYFSKV
ncbi:hypothetical protein ABW19_dt0200095 [Dactylella cylindrospora]|nr:hypothetical protein ABW19_dt0200095 [Dactylella cylindrospora]